MQAQVSHSSVAGLVRLDRRTIIVTGGLGGLGHCLCGAILEAGGHVVCLDMPETPTANSWNALSEIAERHSGRVWYISCDVIQADSVREAFAKAEDLSPLPIRGLVACAGISGRGAAIDYPIDGFRRILDVNVTGTFLCAQEAARMFRRHAQGGSIVMLASMSAHNVNQGVDTCAYNTSKAALLQLARSLAAEWGGRDGLAPIRVNTLSPGYICTPISEPTMNEIPGLRELWTEGNMMNRLSHPHEYRGSVLFLLSEASSYMTAADLRVDGGHVAW